MSVIISSIEAGSAAAKAGICAGDTLIAINGNEIVDVLDYRFYQNDTSLEVAVIDKKENRVSYNIKKAEYDELGLQFETYLMDKQRSCKNKCVFCFIDQLPKGMRDSLYFKDDDSRLSFLFGNYITLTNISEHEVERIIKMHISPINISVHTTNPELRVKMMNNRFAGDALNVLWRLCDASISINCQLVLCPGYNDGDELRKTLEDLTKRPSIKSIACVPVGLTAYREGLAKLEPFNEQTSAEVIDIIDEYGQKTIEQYEERRCYSADEFYLMANRPFPPAEFYGEFAQLENGVGMCSLLWAECCDAVNCNTKLHKKRKISSVTGEAAYPLIRNIVDIAQNKWHNLNCEVYKIKNEFFGGRISVTGLVTGGDIINQLEGKDLGKELLLPAVMLRRERDMFLDNITVEQLELALNVKVKIVENNGQELIEALIGRKID
ncbi:MAG: DUF512 domain-containing protein [Oscillospiraceae bacterium]|nr:DUF512 domain-containing protein [Oscillospiraceae bacterium]